MEMSAISRRNLANLVCLSGRGDAGGGGRAARFDQEGRGVSSPHEPRARLADLPSPVFGSGRLISTSLVRLALGEKCPNHRPDARSLAAGGVPARGYEHILAERERTLQSPHSVSRPGPRPLTARPRSRGGATIAYPASRRSASGLGSRSSCSSTEIGTAQGVAPLAPAVPRNLLTIP